MYLNFIDGLRNSPNSGTITYMQQKASAQKKSYWVLVSILIVAALLRLTNLSSGDTLSDEVGYGFRAVGMLDFDEAGEQPTPLEWFDPSTSSGQAPIPWWTKLSFHDHPPLVFLIQYVSMQIFGETNLGLRIPSALSGIASVWLLYLIGKQLYGEEVGLAAAALLGLTINHVVISRIGIQESQLIFFILLTLYLFLRSFQKDTYLIWTGAALGFTFLTKYTGLVLVPLFCLYLTLCKREYFLNKKLWIGILLTIIVFSPVLIYNYKLYQAVGHFDFQLSFIFNQPHPEWRVQPGKEEFSSLTARAQNFLPNIFNFNSWIFLTLVAFSFLYILSSSVRYSGERARKHALLFSGIVCTTAVILFAIGPSLRFLSMLTPWMALAGGVGVIALLEAARAHGWRPIALSFVSIIFAFETLYSINSNITNYPTGSSPWLWSRIRYENYNWGYNELGAWLTELFTDKMPAFVFEPKYQFLADIQKLALAQAEHEGREPYSALIIYDRNIQSMAQLWNLDRLQIYHGWPIIHTETYANLIREKGSEYIAKSGVKKTILIIPSDTMPLKSLAHLTDTGKQFEEQVKTRGIEPLILKNKRGDEAFRIYEF